MGMAGFNRMRREQAEKAEKAPRKNAATPGDIWAVMKAGKTAALKLFKGKDHEDPEAAAQTHVDALIAAGTMAAEELTLVKRD